MISPAPWLVASLLFACGCVSSSVRVRGQELPRLTFSYTDNHLYLITHHDAYPDQRGASDKLRAYAGRITGFACGAEIWAESQYRWGYLGMVGYVEPISRSSGIQSHTRPMHLEVRDQHGERRIQGSIGDDMGEMFTSFHGAKGSGGGPAGSPSSAAGDTGAPWMAKSHTIDFAFSSAQLHGTIGSRKFDLHTDGNDNMVGTVFMGGRPLPFVLVGVSELWSMPASDQAAILPMVLTCEDEASESNGLVDLRLPPILSVSFAANHLVR
ncbi:MAG TPA: hypothetical protein VGL86_22805 [Polyangia bacterium]|jgi:hypothetical protein